MTFIGGDEHRFSHLVQDAALQVGWLIHKTSFSWLDLSEMAKRESAWIDDFSMFLWPPISLFSIVKDMSTKEHWWFYTLDVWVSIASLDFIA